MTSKQMHVLVAGAGVAGMETALALCDLAGDRVQVDVLAPQDELYYWPLVMREPFGIIKDKGIDLEPIFAHAGLRFRKGVLVSVDAARRTVTISGGEEIPFDALVIACGATHSEAVAGALTFPGLGAADDFRALLDDAASGHPRIAFALPSGSGWPMPIYELALLTATEFKKRGVDASLILVTPESDPLGLFGETASDAVRGLLKSRNIELLTQTYPIAVEHAGLRIRPGGLLGADRVVALSRVEGRDLAGLPRDANGFIPVDVHGAVVGLDNVYAAGDITTFPLKQGGIAAQQALAVAESIAVKAGASVTANPFRPVLRGLLLTGGGPQYYLSSELTGGYGESSLVSPEALWWPPAKIASRYLGPALSALGNLPVPDTPKPDANVVPIEVEFSTDATSFSPELPAP